MNRAQRRKAKKGKKKDKQGDIGDIMDMFDKIPDHCLACEKPYDSKDKNMITTWNVVVRNKEQKVNLYCPECWTMARKLTNKIKEKK